MEAAFDSCMAFHESVRMSPDSQATRIEALRRLQEFGDACNRTPNVALRPSTVAQLLALLREAASAGTAEFVAAMAATFSNGVMGVPARDPDPVRKHQVRGPGERGREGANVTTRSVGARCPLARSRAGTGARARHTCTSPIPSPTPARPDARLPVGRCRLPAPLARQGGDRGVLLHHDLGHCGGQRLPPARWH
jgi:hypothetical protein